MTPIRASSKVRAQQVLHEVGLPRLGLDALQACERPSDEHDHERRGQRGEQRERGESENLAEQQVDAIGLPAPGFGSNPVL
jgi:hypothetical protein